MIIGTLMCLTGSQASAQTAQRIYELNGSYAETNGGSALVPNGGSLGSTGYSFTAGQGPNVSNALANIGEYSIEMTFRFDKITSFNNILNFNGRTGDPAVYCLDGRLVFYNYVTGNSSTVDLNAGQLHRVVITRNATTKVTTGYVDGVQKSQVTDTANSYVASASGGILHFFRDDGGENSAGFVDQIRIYHSVLTPTQVAGLGPAASPWQAVVNAGTPTVTHYTPVAGASPVNINVGNFAAGSARSFEFVFTATGAGPSKTLLGSQASSSGAQYLKLHQFDNTGKFGLTTAEVADYVFTNSPTISNQRVHAVFASNGSVTTLYLNGVAQSGTINQGLKITGRNGLGAFERTTQLAYQDNLDGTINGFASYARALTQAEVTARYNALAGIAPNTPPVVAVNAPASFSTVEGTAPTKSGTFSDANGNATVTLTASAGTITQNNAAGTWSWTGPVADGPASSTVTITATDTASAVATTSFTSTITNVAPVVVISAPASANEDTVVNFTFTATDASSADQAAGFAWSIDYGNGQGTNISGGTASPRALTYTYPNPGTYTISATATDKNSGVSMAATRSISIIFVNTAPTLAVTAPASVSTAEGIAPTKSGTFSDAQGNATVTLTASSGTITQNNATGNWSWIGAIADGPASSTVTITATDTVGAVTTTTFTSTITNVVPVVVVSAPASANEDAPVNFSFTATDASSADQAAGFAWSINYGDGSAIQTLPAGTISPPGTIYTYPNPGSYTVTVTATDKDSGVSLAGTKAITINDLLPEIAVEQPVGWNVTDGSAVNFGTLLTGTNALKVVTVKNTGLDQLQISGLDFTGSHAIDFSASGLSLPASIAPGGSATFTVAFNPSVAGSRNASLQIVNDDADENPFDLVLSGTGSNELSATLTSLGDAPVTARGFNATGKTLNLSLGFAPAPGAQLMLVNNTSIAFINGQFTGLAQGQRVTLTYNGDSYDFVADYYAGTGNDLVLRWAYNRLVSWGKGGNGQLGNGGNSSRLQPLSVASDGILAGKTILAGSTASVSSILLCSDGTLVSFGGSLSGRNPDITSYTPIAVDQTGVLAGKRVIAVSAGRSHVLVLCSDGTVASWGGNFYGELGINSTVNTSFAPNLVDTSGALAGKTVVQISTSRYMSLALCSDGTLVRWGLREFDENNNRVLASEYAPTIVSTAGTDLEGKSVVAISSGFNCHFALCSDGSFVSWGRGAGTGAITGNVDRGRPTAVVRGALTGRAITQFSAGFLQGIALCSDGSAVSWGKFSGDGVDTGPRTSPTLVDAGTSSAIFGKTTIKVLSSLERTIALCSDGTIAGWGSSTYGYVGDGTDITRVSPVEVLKSTHTPGDRYIDVFMGAESEHSLALVAFPANSEIAVEQPSGSNLADSGTVNFGSLLMGDTGSKVFTIKNTGLGQLRITGLNITGSGSADYSTNDLSLPASIAPGASTTFTVNFAPSAGGSRIAALQVINTDEDENPFDITLSGTGNTVLAATFATPTDVARISDGFSASGKTINLTLGHTPAVGATLTVIKNIGASPIQGVFDNLANGSSVSLPFNGTNHIFVAWYYGGDGNDLVLLWPSTGISMWGDNNKGQLGDNSSLNSRRVPINTTLANGLDNKTVVDVACGSLHTLALTTEGRVYAWGLNAEGQLGDGTLTDRLIPTPVLVDSGALQGRTVIALAAGHKQSYALCSDGEIASWGWNAYGQLGNATNINSSVPVLVSRASGASALFNKTPVAISAGEGHALALCSDGTFVSWGFGSYGQLGDGSASNRYTPVLVNRASGTSALHGKTVVAVSAGYYHSLALCSDGSIAVWGYGFNGLLGTGSAASASVYTPTAVSTASGLSALAGRTPVAIAATISHSLALCSDGALVAWGQNIYGSLGNNSTEWSAYPVIVNAQSGVSALFGKTVTSIHIVGRASQALCSDGSIVSWGANSSGQLGDNTNTNRMVPVLVDMSPSVSALHGKKVIKLGGSGHNGGFAAAIYALPVSSAAVARAAADSWIGNAGLSGPGALPTAEPFGDGVPNLLKYAFNMPLDGPRSNALNPAGGPGANGLPVFTVNPTGPNPTFTAQFIRRRNSGLNYVPQRTTSPTAPFTPMTAPQVVTPIDADWELVTVEEPLGSPIPSTFFSRVQVSLP